MIPRFQFAGLESSQLDDAPNYGTRCRLRACDLVFVRDLLITHLS
jgi:hypothetical protein